METASKTKITWEKIIEIEPEINQLYEIAKNENRSDLPEDYCANDVFYNELKPEIMQLAGWYAEDRRLKSTRAYELVYMKIYDALPYCRHERGFC